MNTAALRLDDIDDLDLELDDDLLSSFNQPQADDYTTKDLQHFYQNEVLALVIYPDTTDPDAWKEEMRRHMDRESHWPNVWITNRYGARLLDVWTDD